MCLKETKKSHKTDRVDNGLAKIMTTAMKISSKIIKGLLQSPGQGKTVFLNSVENQVTKKTKAFIHKLLDKRLLDTGVKKYTKPAAGTSVLKEDAQNFGLLVVKTTTTSWIKIKWNYFAWCRHKLLIVTG